MELQAPLSLTKKVTLLSSKNSKLIWEYFQTNCEKGTVLARFLFFCGLGSEKFKTEPLVYEKRE